MPRYDNLSGRSGVDSYVRNRDGSITVFFTNGSSYTYEQDEDLYYLAAAGVKLNRTLTSERPSPIKKRKKDRIRRFFARRSKR